MAQVNWDEPEPPELAKPEMFFFFFFLGGGELYTEGHLNAFFWGV